jgi:hypothetical protein
MKAALTALLLCGLASPLSTWAADAEPPAGAARAAAGEVDDADDDAGAAAKPGARRPRAARSVLKFGVDDVLLEVGATPDHPTVSGTAWLRASPYLLWQPSRDWELRAGIQLEAVRQNGTTAYSDSSADLDDTYIRWRSGDTRLTLGAQTIVWGRVDGMPLIDRVSRADISRLLLDDLPERRDPLPALRWEQDWDDIKLDVVLLPAFEGAELPDRDSLWNPINRRNGRVLGIAPSPALAALVTTGSVGQDDGGRGGAALRLTRTGEPFDMGLTLARTRQSLPYLAADFAGNRLTAVHPFNSFVGVDIEWVGGDATWRSELGYTRDVPVTSLLGQQVEGTAVEWIGAVEFFPGGKDLRVNLQLLSRVVRADVTVLELTRYLGVNGEVEASFGQGRWKLGLQFASGLSVHDIYLGPRLTYAGWEPHEIVLSLHGFRGNERTLGGFYRDNAYAALAWRTSF